MSNTMWMLRAGEGARLMPYFIEHSVVAIGLSELGYLDNQLSKEALNEYVRSECSHLYERPAISIVSLLFRFLNNINIGDNILSYDAKSKIYYIGEVISEPFFDEDIIPQHPRLIKVKWMSQVEKKLLCKSTQNQLGAALTLFQVTGAAREEMLKFIGVR